MIINISPVELKTHIIKQGFIFLKLFNLPEKNMKNIYTLNLLNEGEKCKIKKLLIEGNMRKRLRDIGLIEGTSVECLKKSASGDPTAYLIRGAVIALRSDDTAKIIILKL